MWANKKKTQIDIYNTRIYAERTSFKSRRNEKTLYFDLTYPHRKTKKFNDILVNLDQQFKHFMSTADRKKTRKKEYKRKKKQKRKEEQQFAKRRLANIIRQIYQGTTNFQQSKLLIENSINQLIGDQKFHVFLNQAIKIHAKNMQKQIWDFMQTILKQNTQELYAEDQQFELHMIEYIYQLFCNLQRSSHEVEKIINMYMCINSNSDRHLHDQYRLARSTFKFMIDSDDRIKNLLNDCRRKICPKHTQCAQYIRQLTQMIDKSDWDNYPDDEQQTEKSTSIDEEEQQKQKERRRKRRKKFKDSDFCSSLQEVVRRLNEMVIMQEKRKQCQVSEQWASSLKQRYKYS